MVADVFGLVGRVVAQAFQVEAVVAEGGFAVVYRAQHTGFRAPVALKCLKVPQHLGASEQAEFTAQFRTEAEVLFHLSAGIPAVVRPLHVDAMIAPGGIFVPFMALEWLEGETLDAHAKRRRGDGLPPIALAELMPLLTPVARALDEAHHFITQDGASLSVVHRDLKPENFYLCRVAGEQRIKVLDFGIAQVKSFASEMAGRGSQERVELGPFSPAFGAPEQWNPTELGPTGPWTDVWGLALTMVELMAGRPIIDGDQGAMMRAALDPVRRPTPLTEGIPVSEDVDRVFRDALAVRPQDRWRWVATFWDALEQAAVGAGRTDTGLGSHSMDVGPHGSPGEFDLDAAATVTQAGAGEFDLDDARAATADGSRTSNPPPRLEAERGGPRPLDAAPRSLASPVSLIPASLEGVANSIRGGLAGASSSRSQQLRAPVLLIAVGIGLSALDMIYASSTGEMLSVGGATLRWVTVPSTLAGVILLVLRLATPGGGDP